MFMMYLTGLFLDLFFLKTTRKILVKYIIVYNLLKKFASNFSLTNVKYDLIIHFAVYARNNSCRLLKN